MRLSALSIIDRSTQVIRGCRGATAGVLAAAEAALRRVRIPGLIIEPVVLDTGVLAGILDRTCDGIAMRHIRFPEHTFVIGAWGDISERDLICARWVVVSPTLSRTLRRFFSFNVPSDEIGGELSATDEIHLGFLLGAVDEAVACACESVERQLLEDNADLDADELGLFDDDSDTEVE